jgi:hypothetical protein
VSQLRRFAFPLRLVGARLATGGQRLALVAAGVVAGAAVLAAVLGGRLVMQDRALEQATAQLQPGDREVAVAWSGSANSFARLNAFVAPRVREITGRPPAAAMLFREASIQSRLVNLRAADELGRWVRLVSGRLPQRCVPSHCEVLRLAGNGPIPSTPNLRLIEVGRAVLKPDAPFAPFVLPAPPTEMVAQAVRYHTPQPSPIVIANGVAGLSDNTELETFYRSYAWFVPIGRGDVHPWAVDAFRAKVQRLAAEIQASSDGFQVTAPTDALATAAAASTAAARRLLLLGGEGGALLLAFTILAAAAMRRRRGDRGSRGLACGRRDHARPRLQKRDPDGDRRRPGRGTASLRDRPGAGRPARPPRDHTTRHRRDRRDRGRRRRLGTRVGRLATAHRRARHERIPAAGAGADRLRGRRRCGPAPRADAARAWPGGPARPDRPAAGRQLARP